ncbi:MAG TPA: DNA polymerase ligase N-terminal domain-containing protein [Micromonosporaceae bacterium]|jgi:bifunctional non-homologous end joining protein LigD
MGDGLDEYRRKRDAARTPEPVPAHRRRRRAAGGATFVIQQHHARALHWDLRLERDGVLVSWAVPRGIPKDPRRNHLAVHTEDHPMEYAEFSGEIPEGEYGAGRMTIFDHGTYEAEKWRDNEVIFELHGERVSGRYALFQTDGKNWMIHRMDPPEPGWTPMPTLRPMLATRAARLPSDDAEWGYELAWSGLRAMAQVSGGRLELVDGDGKEVTDTYPELRALAESLAPTECLLDGVIVAFDASGRVDAEALRPRAAATGAAAIRRLASRTPVQYLVVDLLWLDGTALADVPYAERRERLAAIRLGGLHWQAPPHFAGGGQFALQTSREQGLVGVIAKRLDSPYRSDTRSRDWLEIRAKRR